MKTIPYMDGEFDGLILFWKKSGLHPPTIAKVQFSTFNYEIERHRPSNCQNWANFALKVIFHFVRIKNIQFYTKNFITYSF